MSNNTVRVAHISDIHFYESSDGVAHHYKHDLNCLRQIRALFDIEKPEYLIVTGDITNIGDKLSLERAYQWIHDRIYVDGEYYGLECDKQGIIPIIVPGNHDAFNAPTHGANYKRWQSSLTNFYSAFPNYAFVESEHSVDYRWITKGATKLFVCRLDSCYLGDPETEDIAGTLSIDKVAKGRISRSQSAKTLEIYDKALLGELPMKVGSAERIKSGEFMHSLKLIVLHHYLFEPSDSRAEPLLQIADKRAVFQNIAMSDFDVLLCGHKHIGDVQVFSYLDQFDPRARLRLAFNHVRRSLGIGSLPIKADDDGKLVSRMFRFVLSMLYLSKTKGRGLTDKHVDEILNVLEKGLVQPAILREELLSYVGERGAIAQAGLFDDEVRELYNKIKAKFDIADRRALVEAAKSLHSLVEKLGGRPFAHISSASSAKSSETLSRNRSVSVYHITNDAEAKCYRLLANRFGWNQSATTASGLRGDFSRSVSQEIRFPYGRISNFDDANLQTASEAGAPKP